MTTFEELYSHYPATASIIPFKDWLIVAFPSYRGVEARIYEAYDLDHGFTPYDASYYEIYEDEDQVFTDQGHAVKWAFDMIENIAIENGAKHAS